MRSSRSAKKTALKRLSSSFGSDESSSDNTSSSDNFDLPDSSKADEKQGLVFNEKDIILVEYPLPSSPESKKKETRRRRIQGKGEELNESFLLNGYFRLNV